MYRLLILGGAKNQLPLILEAKELGYYVILCDYTTTNPGIQLVDRHYQVSTLDREAVLEVARKENIDGVISNSEPAMANVAYVAEQLGIQGNSVESIDTLLSKYKFRKLQREVGVYAPESYVVSSEKELLRIVGMIQFPIIIKPTESSGTRGTTRIDEYNEIVILSAYTACCEFSRNNKVSVEEYVEMNSLRVNEADIFVIGDEVMWDGWVWAYRAPDTPMLPMTNVFPIVLSENEKQKIQETVEKIIKAAGIKHGEYNLETYFNTEGEVFVIEINPRQGGNYIPKLIEQHTGVNLTKLLVTTAVRDMRYYEYLKGYIRENNYVTLHIVFSKKKGIFDRLYIDPELEGYMIWSELMVKPGDWIVRGKNATEAIAYADFQFPDYETQHKYTDNIEKYIYPIVIGRKNEYAY